MPKSHPVHLGVGWLALRFGFLGIRVFLGGWNRSRRARSRTRVGLGLVGSFFLGGIFGFYFVGCLTVITYYCV